MYILNGCSNRCGFGNGRQVFPLIENRFTIVDIWKEKREAKIITPAISRKKRKLFFITLQQEKDNNQKSNNIFVKMTINFFLPITAISTVAESVEAGSNWLESETWTVSRIMSEGMLSNRKPEKIIR